MSRPDQTWTLPREPSATIEARRLVAGMCDGLPAEHVDAARLLVSELTMNAIQHGTGEVTLVVAREGGSLRVEVHDQSSAMPVLTDGSVWSERGRGLQLVAAFSSSWGALPLDDGQPGKRVWFTLS
jgi:anti-sigma regulatory factor (Ser/Thr protein kinase)